MATGDQNDIIARLKSYLPRGWFGDFSATPVINAVLAGIASNLAVIYTLIQFFKAQARLTTSSGGWVDMWAADFLGQSLPRLYGETDAAYIVRIQAMVLQKRATRQAMVTVLTNLTGKAPVIFEPNRPMDSGGFGRGQGAFFGVSRFGSLACPYNALITVYRPGAAAASSGAAYMDAVTISAMNTPTAYGYTATMSSEAMNSGDAGIYAAINATRPIGTNVGVALHS